jgi:Tfp pilus assembly protein PilX
MTGRLRSSDARTRLLRSGRDESGYVLITAVAVTALALMLGMSVATVAMKTSVATGVDRQRSGAIAAAEAGIDLVRGQFRAATSTAAATATAVAWPCTSPQTVTVGSDPDTSSVTVTLRYVTAGGVVTTCAAAPAWVEVTSTAVVVGALRSGGQVTRTMRAMFTLASGSAPSVTTVKQAVFGDAGISGQNQLTVNESTPGALDGNVYSNAGVIACPTAGTIHGSVVTQADVVFKNTCVASGRIWAGGRVDASLSNVQIAGDVYAAAATGTGIALGNTARIGGNAYANADVTLGDGSVAGSVLSTQGKITFQNAAHIDGSAYSRLGLSYTTGGTGQVLRDVVASAGSIAGPTSLNPGEYSWSIGGSAAVSPSGCIANSVTITGAVSRAQQGPSISCALPASALSPTVTLPGTPNNPPAVAPTPMPAMVAAPPAQPFPKLYAGADPVTGADSLQVWRSAGWDVHVFSGIGSQPCTDALAYLKAAESGSNHAAWVAQPLAIVIRGCTDSISWDQNNRDLMGGGSTFTLYNDLAVIADGGMGNQNGFTFASDGAATRSLLWIVPTDSPAVNQGGSSPTCLTPANLVPNNVTATGVAWLLFTPCAATPLNSFGTAVAPIHGAVYGGSVSLQQAFVTFVPMSIPGFDDGSSTTGTASVDEAYRREVSN